MTDMHYTLNIRGRLFDLSEPCVMGIINVTPDSFYPGSRCESARVITHRARQIMDEGGKMIDVGAFSTRPGADPVSQDEELRRLEFALPLIREAAPQAIISVDTFRPEVAERCVKLWGADIINDVSEGGITGIADVPLPAEDGAVPRMFETVAELGVPYVLMSVRGEIIEMLRHFAREVSVLRSLGVKEILLDPGYGFGKTLSQNYEILRQQKLLCELGLPLLVGVSRKRMIREVTGTSVDDCLDATTAVHVLSLLQGAGVLRVHDVAAAVQAVQIYGYYQNNTLNI